MKKTKLRKLPRTGLLIDVDLENPKGWWESETSAGHCEYVPEEKAVHLGGICFYGPHYHYPSGKPDLDAQMLREIEKRKIQWAAMLEHAEDFQFPVEKIFMVGCELFRQESTHEAQA